MSPLAGTVTVPAEHVGAGGVGDAIVHVCTTGTGRVARRSTAAIARRCSPGASPGNSIGEVHGCPVPPSSVHVNVTPGSFAMKANLAVVELEPAAAGADVMTTLGGVTSGGGSTVHSYTTEEVSELPATPWPRPRTGGHRPEASQLQRRDARVDRRPVDRAVEGPRLGRAELEPGGRLGRGRVGTRHRPWSPARWCPRPSRSRSPARRRSGPRGRSTAPPACARRRTARRTPAAKNSRRTARRPASTRT